MRTLGWVFMMMMMMMMLWGRRRKVDRWSLKIFLNKVKGGKGRKRYNNNVYNLVDSHQGLNI